LFAPVFDDDCKTLAGSPRALPHSQRKALWLSVKLLLFKGLAFGDATAKISGDANGQAKPQTISAYS